MMILYVSLVIQAFFSHNWDQTEVEILQDNMLALLEEKKGQQEVNQQGMFITYSFKQYVTCVDQHNIFSMYDI